jgi:hypothetical protein
MDACVRQNAKRLHVVTYCHQGIFSIYYYRTDLAPSSERLASGSDKCEAPPQVMIVRRFCAWCMEACCLFCMVPSCSCGLSRHPLCTYTHTHLLALPSLAAAAATAAVSRRQPVKSAHAYQTHGVLRLSRSSSVCVCHDVRSSLSRPRRGQTSGNLGSARIMRRSDDHGEGASV